MNAGGLTSSGGNTVAAGSADYNGDGWNDVFLSNTGADPSYLLRNLTNGTFGVTSGDPNVPAAGNLNSPYTPVFADYDNDGRLDLYLTFLQGPDGLATTNRLYRNLDGTNFLRITNAGLPVTLVANSDSAAWADLDADGWVDLVVAYRNRSQVGVYRNLGDGTFSDFTSTANLNISALSVSLGDYDDDGRLDVACLSADYPNSIFKLFRNLGSFTFTNLTNTTITPAPESFSVRWQDYNNDGKIDLRLYGFDQLAQIWTNSGTGAFSLSFQSTNCGIATADFNLDGRIDEVPLAGTVAADLNHDGLPDILKATGANEQLWTNQWNGAGWLVVKLVGQQSNRTGIGAKIRATATVDGNTVTQTRQISGGEGYGLFVPLEAYFGFGDATNISLLRIEWPSGKVQEFTNVVPNQFLTIQEQTIFYFGVNGSGSVSYAPVKSNYFVGENITLTATTNRYYRFLQWSDGNTNAVRNYTVGLSNVLTAHFTNTVALEYFSEKKWEAEFGGSGGDNAAGLAMTADGGFALAGWSGSDASGNKTIARIGTYDYWLVKTDSSGSKQWDTAFGGTNASLLGGIASSSDGGYLLGGYSYSGASGNKTTSNFGDSDYWVVKVNTNGVKQWEADYGGSTNETLTSVVFTSDGGWIIGGYSQSGASGNKATVNYGSTDYWVVKLDSNGNKQWEANYGGSGGDSLRAVKQTLDGGFILAGYSGSGVSGNKTSPVYGPSDFWVVKINALGGKQWEQVYGTGGSDTLLSIDSTADGGCILGGFTDNGAYGLLDWYVVRIDAAGNQLWAKNYGGTGEDSLAYVKATIDGGCIVAGESRSTNSGNKATATFGNGDAWMLKLDAYGTKQWEINYGGTNQDELVGVALATDGGYVALAGSASDVSGNKTAASFGGGDFWAFKLMAYEQPIGTPIVRVNGSYNPTNHILTNGIHSLSIQSTFTNAHIFYTLDGTSPSSNSLAYTTNFSLVYSTTVRAIAYNSNYTASAEADPVVISIAPYVFFTGSIGSGTVTRSPDTNTYTLGQQVTLTATPSRYFTFVKWSDGVTSTNRTFSVGSGSVFTAIFTNTVPLEELVIKQWDVSFGGAGNEDLRSVWQTPGGFIVSGQSASGPSGNKTADNIGSADFWAINLGADGRKLWDKAYGGTGHDAYGFLARTGDGGFVAGGGSASGVGGDKTGTSFGGDDVWIIRLDADGYKVWDRAFGGSQPDGLFCLGQTRDGGFFLGGESYSAADGNKMSPGFGTNDFWFLRLDLNGNKLWEKSFGGTGNDQLTCAQETADGGFILGGTSNSGTNGNKTSPNLGGDDCWVIRLDASGNKLWEHTYGGGGFDALWSLQQTTDGGYILGEKFGGDYGVIRTDALGNEFWAYSIGGTNEDVIRSIRQTADGGFILAGYSGSGPSGDKTAPTFGGTDYWLVRLDASGSKRWEQSFGGSLDDVLFALDLTADGGMVLGGTSFSGTSGNHATTNYGGSDYWIVNLALREAPIGTPLVLVNERYSPTNSFPIPATNSITVALQTSFNNGYLFYTLDGSTPVPYEPNTFTYAEPGGPGTPFIITNSLVLIASAFDENGENEVHADPVTISVVPVYNLTNTTPGGGSVAMNPSGGIYLSNTVISLTATPSNGWTFLRWEGAITNTNNPVNLTINASSSIQAVFGTGISNNISPVGSGTVSLWPPTGPYPFGSSVRITPVPGTPTNRFNRWFNNVSGPTTNPLIHTVTTANTNINTYFATLAANTFTLTAIPNGYGAITRNTNANSYASNTVVTLTAVPDAGYVFTGWSGDASGLSNPINVTVNSNKVVTASFVIAGSETNQPPVVAITNPVPGAIFTAPVNISINTTNQDSDGTVTQVVFRAGVNLLGTVASEPFSFTWTNAPIGTNSLTAIATDNGGLSTTSAPISVIVQTAVPQIVLTAPTNNASFFTPANVSITAIASDADNTISNVTFYAGTNLLTTLTAQPYSITWSNVAVGSYALSARVQDTYGPIVTSAPVNITVSAPPGTNPPVFRFNPGGYTVNASNGSVVLTVVNDGDLGGLVNYTTLDGTAHGGSGYSGDYTTQLGSLTFTNGQHSTNITIGIRNNFLNAPDVTFQVQLFQPSAGTLGSPAVATVTIQRNDPSGATNSLTSIAVGSSQPATSGALQVALTPPEAGGQWRFPWDIGWRTNGDTATGLEAENYPVEFRNVSNFVAYPASLTVAVTNGGTTPATGEYHPGLESSAVASGSLTVNISPNAPGGSGWRLFGEAGYRASNSTASNLLADTYFIEFAPVGGWAKPASRAVLVAAGQGTTIQDNYLLPQSLPPGAGTPGQLLHSQIVNPVSFPYWFNGQLQTDAGFGSGVAVRETVVLTAAHMVFNDTTLSYVKRAWWSYQKESGVFDPKPLEARGWYVLSGYAAQRTNDIPNPPAGAGVSSAASRNLDVAALYFTTPAARGGFGGYLASDVVPNPWLTDGARLKMLVGYPVDGSSFGQTVTPGRMYSTPQVNSVFTHATNNNYTAGWFISHPGNSGGPVYVSFNGYFYPAAVYLGTLGSGVNSVSVVRAINSDVVNLINLASSLGDAGTNNNGGGVITLIASSVSAANPAYVRVLLGPTAALQAGAGWRLSGDATYGSSTNYTRTVTSTNAIVEFKPLVGWNPPNISSYTVQAGALTTIPSANYTQIVPTPPSLLFVPASGFGITGTTNTKYRIEYTTNLAGGGWSPLQTNTITGGGFNLLMPFPPTNGLPAAFYRAVWLP